MTKNTEHTPLNANKENGLPAYSDFEGEVSAYDEVMNSSYIDDDKEEEEIDNSASRSVSFDESDSMSDREEKPKEKFSFFKVSSQKKWTLLQVCLSNMGNGMCYSILAPFFPAEAARKGMSTTLIGVVFSSYELMMFLTAVIFGKYMSRLGPKFAFVAGQVLDGGCTFMFGLMHWCPAGAPFAAMSIVLRIVSSLGGAMFSTASFTLIAHDFPEYITTLMSVLEVFMMLGLCVGPLIGGILNEYGGFQLPFFILGGGMLILSGVAFCSIPKLEDDSKKDDKKISPMVLFRSPLTFAAALYLLCAFCTFGFMDSSLAIHLEQFNLNSIESGALFMIGVGIHMILAPPVGWVVDKKNITYPFMIAGLVMLTVSMLLIGPSPLLKFIPTKLWLIVICLTITGTAAGGTFSPTIRVLYNVARHLGIPKGTQIDSLIGGFLSSAIHCGIFFGPLLGNSLMEHVGYDWATTAIACICFVSLLILSTTIVVEKVRMKYRAIPSEDESDTIQLLDPPKPKG